MSIIKSIHVLCALLSISGFIYRAILKLRDSEKLKQKWLKIAPHIIDTILLLSAIYLVISSEYYPELFNWVSAKIVALLLYILFGLFTLRFCKTQQGISISFILALSSFAYIVYVANSKLVWIF